MTVSIATFLFLARQALQLQKKQFVILNVQAASVAAVTLVAAARNKSFAPPN